MRWGYEKSGFLPGKRLQETGNVGAGDDGAQDVWLARVGGVSQPRAPFPTCFSLMRDGYGTAITPITQPC